MKYVTKHRPRFLIAVATSLCWLGANAEPVDTETVQTGTSILDKCLLDGMETAEPDMTIGELRAQCERIVSKTTNADVQVIANQPMTPVQERMLDEQISYNRQFAISAFMPNYLLGTYSSNPNEKPFRSASKRRSGETCSQPATIWLRPIHQRRGGKSIAIPALSVRPTTNRKYSGGITEGRKCLAERWRPPTWD